MGEKVSSRIHRNFSPPNRILLGGGPSNVDPRVLKAMGSPIVGFLDPYFLDVMDEVVELLRYVFRTKNKFCLPLSGTGTAGMEAAICNFVEKEDEVIVGLNGFFGERMSEIVRRCGGKSIEVNEQWGKAITKEAIEKALSQSKAKIVAIIHAETSTGVLQPIKEISEITRKHDALLIVDTVTSLGGCQLEVDDFGIDICYSASQKCLGCPPGLAPLTLGGKALEYLKNRRTKVQSWYLDLSLIEKYWSEGRFYHHTAPISLIYGLREALTLIREEGLEKIWERHKINSLALISGIEAMGMNMYPPEHRLPTLNAVAVPNGISNINVKKTLLNDFSIEIAGGLGVLKDKIWRIGLMGVSSSKRNVLLVLEALEAALRKEGYQVEAGMGVKTATETFDSF